MFSWFSDTNYLNRFFLCSTLMFKWMSNKTSMGILELNHIHLPILLLLKCSSRSEGRGNECLQLTVPYNPCGCSREFLRTSSWSAYSVDEELNIARLVQGFFLEPNYLQQSFPALDPRLKLHLHEQTSS
ncbi:unnamed protein product [Ilex paraguariensis]|uniref:Uncharacterized protein n=1 Tax=Ilex paraguariensis TaxID=185542 RepID=A0ABC8QNX4_9AQUA